MLDEQTLVSVGIPIRNGAATLELALNSVVNQTYKNLEIIISDNNSSDETAEICKRFVNSDSRIKYFRQEKTITIIENFRFVFEQSSGKYFMWVAHDDLRDENYVEVLLDGFIKYPDASIVFSNIAIFNDYSAGKECRAKLCTIHQDENFRQKHKILVENGACQIYGLINSKYLGAYTWIDVGYGGDWLILHWIICYGNSIYVPGTFLHYYSKPSKTINLKKYNYYLNLKNKGKQVEWFPDIQWAWACTKLIRKTLIEKNIHINFASMYIFFCFVQRGGIRQWTKQFIYKLFPKTFKLYIRKLKLT